MSQDSSALDAANPSSRRFWLLRFLVEKLEPAEALAIAERMENFVVGGHAASPAEAEKTEAVKHRGAEPAALAAREAAGRSLGANVLSMPSPGHRRAPQGAEENRSGDVAPISTSAPPRLLNPAALRDFVAAAEAGVDNAELGRRFNLTPRQANGIRLGLTKRKILRGRGSTAASRRPEIDRATELRLQVDFLQHRPPSMKSMEDVVRFIRQRGDSVVRSGEGFLVNCRLQLTAEQMVERANAKLAQLGQPPFPADIWQVRPAVPTTRNGTAHGPAVRADSQPTAEPR